MTSLKRVLDDGDSSYVSEAARNGIFSESTIYNETPVFVDQSWTDVWSGLLSPHSSYSENDFFSSNLIGDEASLYFAQNGIESWATQELFLSDTVPLQLPTPAGWSPGRAQESVEGSNRQLCYGMIYRVAVKLKGDMSEVDAELNETNGARYAGFCIFRIKTDQAPLSLAFSDGVELGHVNTHISKALQAITDQPRVELEAVAETLTLRETIGRVTKANDAIARVNINVYGPDEARNGIGRTLSSNSVYLQHPDQQRLDSTYANPHFMNLPSVEDLSVNQKSDEGNDGASKLDDAEQFRTAVSDVYASLKRGSRLQRLQGDDRLRTTLLPHQQEALDFLMQREVGPVPPEFRLWQPIHSNGQSEYRHAITQATTRIQYPETGGGILADEMGMGKSLSILLLIVKTLEDAYKWQANQGATSSCATRRSSRATLVVVPSALLINGWLEEIDRHLDERTLKVIKYHGQNRRSCLSAIEDADIVITTYHTLATEFKSKRSSPLHGKTWFRIVLDEAHVIRRQATTLYQTVSELNANHRWCLTGTPIQNRLEDIGALFAFVRARPFDAMSMFRKFITIPFDESEECRAIASQRLALLLDSVCLRRTRDLLPLPGRINRTRIIEFSRKERDQYASTKKILIRTIQQRAGDSKSKKMFGMFQAQLQLRILCNHGTFQRPISWAIRDLLSEMEDALGSIGHNGETKCLGCQQVVPILGSNKVYKSDAQNCAHVLCSECLDDFAQDNVDDCGRRLPCPLCVSIGEPTTIANHGTSNKTDHFQLEGHSSKMEALISDIRQDLFQTKSIVFSCWTRTLDLIGIHLKRVSMSFERIDGDCPLSHRQRILDEFSRNLDMRILIMTTGTGAFGLNLTAANRVFIVEPQWNPSVEMQAISRALRIGQGDSVVITRYLMKRTVEQDMLLQQDRKIKMARMGGTRA